MKLVLELDLTGKGEGLSKLMRLIDNSEIWLVDQIYWSKNLRIALEFCRLELTVMESAGE